MLFSKPAPTPAPANEPALSAPEAKIPFNAAALSHQLIITANLFKHRAYIVMTEHGPAYGADYIGELLLFVNRICDECLNGRPVASNAGKKWFAGELPIKQNISIEIGPDQIISYVTQAAEQDPLGQIKLDERFISELSTFIKSNQAQ